MSHPDSSSTKPASGDDDNEDQAWILDSLVGFLKSPLWSTSLGDFTDRNSIVFDPDDIEDVNGQTVHRQEYEAIFRQYRALVDQLIGSHMTELEINEQQFARACEMAEGTLATKLKRILFEELWAAENYEVFVRLMSKRNVELQLEALEILVHKYGLVYDVFVPIGTSPKNFLSEEHVLREAIIRSLNDMVLDQEENEEKMPKIIKTSVQVDVESKTPIQETKSEEGKPERSETDEADKETVQRDAARLAEIKQKIDRKMNEALQSAMMTSEDETTENSIEENESLDLIPELNQPPSMETLSSNQGEQLQSATAFKTDRRLSAEEIHQRADYLRAQRDKILQQRKKERTERISKYLVKEKNQSINRKDGPDDEQDEQPVPVDHNKEQVLAFRKTLAARLKAEVIQGGGGSGSGSGQSSQ